MSMGCGPNVKCRINDHGWCRLDTASLQDMDQEASNCGFIRVNDRYLLEKYGVTYKNFKCGNCVSFSGEIHGECIEQMKKRYTGALACNNFKKKEEDNLKTFYTKCGIEFKKSSNAMVTGYTDTDNPKCESCPFRIDVKEGWPPVHKRFECRAGSRPPNHKNEWKGSLEDKNTMSVWSLDHELMESIIAFCKEHPDLSASYNQDLDDCRRVVSISCSSNKKGMAAKKELVDKFFGEAKEESEDIDGTCANCEYGIDDGESVLYIKCRESGKEKDVKKNDSCHNYTPVEDDIDWEPKGDLGDQLTDLLEAGDKKENVCPYYISHKEDEAFIQCRDTVNVHHDDWIRPKDDTGELHNRYYHYTCNRSFQACALYQEQKGNRKPSCNTCPNSAFIPEARGERLYCKVKGVEVKGNDSEAICEHHNKLVKEEDVNMEVSKQGSSEDDTCAGCTYLKIKSDECNRINNFRKATPETERCGWYWNAKTGEMGDLKHKESYPDEEKVMEKKVMNELVKPEDKLVEETQQGFDYSQVDTATAAFLQEKEAKITQIRMMSVLAIGKELKEVHEKLANHYQGTFGKWCESIGISRDTAENHIRAYKYVAENFGNLEDAVNIQPSLLFAISKPSAPADLRKAVIDGDITTHKQYKELEAQLKAKEAEKQAEEQKARENYLAAQRYKVNAEQAEQALKQSQSEHQSKNDNHKFEIDNLNRTITALRSQINNSAEPVEVQELRKQLEEAKRQVDILTDELMKPVDVAPAVVEVEKEVERAADKDYEYVSDFLGKFITVHTGQLKNWAKVLGENVNKYELERTKQNLIALNRNIGNMLDAIEDEIANKE